MSATPKARESLPRSLSRALTETFRGEATPLNPKTPGGNASIPSGESIDDLEHSLVPPTILVKKKVRQLKVMCISSPEGGHLVPTLHVAMALAQRKHKVQMVTLAQVGKKIEAKCTKAGVIFEGVAPDVQLGESGEGRAGELMAQDAFGAMFLYYSDTMFEPLKELVEKTKPDAIVADFATPCAWEVADLFGVPVAINIPGPLAMKNLLGSPISKFLFTMTAQLQMKEPERSATMKLIGNCTKLFSERLCLWHTFFGLEDPQPIPPNYFVTGCVAPRTSGTVSETPSAEFNEWLKWVRANDLKVIYVTTGSMQVLTKQQVQALYAGLDRLPQVAIAWSMKEEPQAHLPGGGLGGLPQKFFIRSWMPQAEALQIKEVAVVITHCGWGGLNETINAAKPMVTAAFRADQPLNAAVAKRQGIAESLDTAKLTADAVEKTVTKVLGDPTYLEKAKKLQGLLLKSGGADRCVEVVEELAEHGCAELVSEPPTLATAVVKPVCTRVGYVLFGVALACLAPRLAPVLRQVVQRFATPKAQLT